MAGSERQQRLTPAPSAGATKSSAPPSAAAESRGVVGSTGAVGATAAPSARPSRSAPGNTARRGALAKDQALSPRPRDEYRPGLATSWGETRYSAVTDVPFERDSGGPFYTGSMNYNDSRGAWALANRSGPAYTTSATINLGGALTISLRDAHGHTLSAYRGGNRTVAIGRRGERYSIAVQNRTNERFEVVFSVDGLDVIDGRTASYAKRGYLIGPYDCITIDGFRQSENAVAAFRFGSVANSYAALTGSARNVGVIGVAAFGERGYAARLRAYRERMMALRMNGVEIEQRRTADPFPNRFATAPLQFAR